MSVTEEASRIETGANHARLTAEPPRTASPDAIDPEPSAGERARLANGPLALTRAVTQPDRLLAANAPGQVPRYFVWQRMRPATKGIALIAILLPLGWCAVSAWNEFVGTWTLSWGLLLPLVGMLIVGEAFLMLVGERLPLIGCSSVELQRSGVKLRLFYGRRPRTVGKGFSLLGFIWPCRASIPWADVMRVAIYTATYDRVQHAPRRTMYWVKLWAANGTGYVALITEMEAQAHELANLLAQQAGLTSWATLDGYRSSLINPSLSALDADTLTIWRADQRRIRNDSTMGSITAELWRAPQREFQHSLSLSRRAVIKLAIVAAVLLTIMFSYDYLLSYLLWTPPSPITSDNAWTGDYHDAGNTNASNQTLIPPLHEVWQAKASYGNSSISLGGGKLMLFDRSAPVPYNSIYAYDASSGKLLRQYSLAATGYSYQSGDLVVDGTISPDGNYAYYVVSNSSYSSGSGQSAINAQLNAFDFNSGGIIWQQPLKDSASFLLETQRNLIITSSYITTTLSGTVHSNFVIEALNPQTGKQVWQSGDLGAFAPAQVVVGGDAVYAITSNAGEVTAFDISNGSTRWHISAGGPNGHITALLADNRYVYVNSTYFFTIYSKDGVAQQPATAPLSKPPNLGLDVLAGSQVIGIQFDQLNSINAAGESTFPYDYQNRGHNTYNVNSMAASNKLLWLSVWGDGNLFGNTRLLAFDLQSGRQVWRSPALSGNFSGNQIIIGNGMLYMIYGGEIHAFAGAR